MNGFALRARVQQPYRVKSVELETRLRPQRSIDGRRKVAAPEHISSLHRLGDNVMRKGALSAIGSPSEFLNIYFSEAFWNTDPAARPAPSARRAGSIGETCARHSDASSQQRRSPGHGELRFQRFLAEATDSFSAGAFAADVNARPRLTKGKMRCPAFVSRGLTRGEIAACSPCTVENVDSYLKSAARKLSASKRTHAVAQALKRTLIS